MTTTDDSQPRANAGELTLLDLVAACVKHRRLFIVAPGALVLITLLVVLLIPKTYTARTTIMPPQQNQSNALAIVGQISGLGGFAQSALGLKNPSEIFASILRSRSVADAIITSFNLTQVYNEELIVDARTELEERASVIISKDGVLGIEVDDVDPVRAAEIANAFVKELQLITQRLAVGEASQRRLFFEEQVAQAKVALSAAEVGLREFQETSGLVVPQGQAQLTVSASAGIQAQIAAKEVQISAMRTYATKGNPDLVRLEKEVLGLKEQLAKLDGSTSAQPGGVLVPLGGATKSGLEYSQRLRQVKYAEVLFELLAKQYEIAKVDEANNATLIQVIDKALPPEKESRPRKLLALGIALIVGFVIAFAMALIRESLDSIAADPDQSRKLEAIRAQLRI